MLSDVRSLKMAITRPFANHKRSRAIPDEPTETQVVSGEYHRRMGAYIRMLRKGHGLLQRELADALGVTSNTISDVERGMYALASIYWPAMADLYGYDHKLLAEKLHRLTDPVGFGMAHGVDAKLKAEIDRLMPEKTPEQIEAQKRLKSVMEHRA